jgi:hypothetical protein
MAPWWGAFEAGAGPLKLNSDQLKGGSKTRGAMGFAFGYQPSDWIRAGLHLNGWLMQAFDPYDPTKGESVSNVGGIVDVMPLRRHGLFVRGGYGLSMYTNDHLDGVNGNGPGWEAGGGYEFRIGPIRLAPMAEYSSGRLGKGSPTLPQQTGLRYSVVDLKLMIVGNFSFRHRGGADQSPR